MDFNILSPKNILGVLTSFLLSAFLLAIFCDESAQMYLVHSINTVVLQKLSALFIMVIITLKFLRALWTTLVTLVFLNQKMKNQFSCSQ
ncbi:hypothetical protein A5893_12905 [Pedobacter psychrophilus]|uniref:Uncharacterized protein n=1 Tax=Pedobacter psychrophilus TaxID=1826909 RepID=A0A179DD15_9SPHI|nr:hypothetical protein A5893_12905 [Pedobacter psychrophilus]